MLRLVDNLHEYELKGYQIEVPQFNPQNIKQKTQVSPHWIHFGGGNLFRCFHADIAQELLNRKLSDTGIVVAETFDDEIIETIYHPFANRTLQVVMKADGTLATKVIASVTESYRFAPQHEKDYQTVQNIFRQPSLQIASFTITEKGYNITDISGKLTEQVYQDIQAGPTKSKNTMALMTSLLWERFKSSKMPIAMLSTDNFSHNGDKLKESIITIAKGWLKNNFVTQKFIAYLEDPQQVSFPWSVIDRITPQPSSKVAKRLQDIGFADTQIIKTNKQTVSAPFVNTEEISYLVIEDIFPNGRPPFEKVGVHMTTKKVVKRFEKMKVCTCLNPLHTSLSIFGCLLGYQSIAKEMVDTDLVNLIKQIGYKEGLPVVVNPEIIAPQKFLDQVIKIRLPNANIPDTPQRIVTDTSQKMAIRFGETIKAYQSNNHLDQSNLTFIPLTIAAWLRYLIGIDDQGKIITVSPDPLLDELQSQLTQIAFPSKIIDPTIVQPILSNKMIFGVNLYEVGLGEKVETMFSEMISGPGAVRRTLKKYLEEV